MADATDPDSSDSSSAPDPEQEWYVRQWNALCDELGTSDPTEARARVQAMKRELKQSQTSEGDPDDEGLVTISEVEEVFREMNEKMEKLRERNTALVERLDEGGDDIEGPFRDLHEKAEQLLDSLDAATMDEARERIQTLNQRLEDLYREKEKLAQAGLSDAADALDTIEQLREERDRLRDKLDALPGPEALPETAADRLGVSTASEAQTLANTVRRIGARIVEHYEDTVEFEEVEPDADDALTLLHSLEDQLRVLPEAPSSDEDTLPAEAGDILGIRTVEDARELESLIADLSDRLNRLKQKQEKLEAAGLTVETALSMIENMNAQLEVLYHGADSDANGTSDALPSPEALDAALQERVDSLLDTDLSTADDLSHVVRMLTDRLDRLAGVRASLAEQDLDPDEAAAMIQSMEGQLSDLYHASDAPAPNTPADAADRLAAIEDVLGISTREEAEELSEIAHQMEEQLTTLYEEKEKLEDLGLSSIEDAVDMIENMEDQLVDLYEDKEALRDVQLEDTEQQSTFQQLEALYAERERMQQALGVSSADDVIELVESLSTQLEELYERRDAEIDPDERHDAMLWSPEPDPSSERTDRPDEADTLTLNSMEHQLEALYREKETLLHHGLSTAQEAVSQLQTQQKQIDALQRENHTYEQRFDRLQSELGTTSVAQLVEAVETLASDAGASLEEALDTATGPPDEPEYGLDIGATSPFVDEDTLDRLDEMDATALDALDVGAVRLDNDGTVEALNEAAFQLPGLPSDADRSAVVGKNFFLDLAPSTNNNLFHGRFREGQRRGAVDARFPYTFTSPDEGPRSYAVHLYRPPDGEATWLLYRPT
jgi:photoactive yellow protein